MKTSFQTLFLVFCVVIMLGGAFYLGFRGGTSPTQVGQVLPKRPVQVDFSGDQVASRLSGVGFSPSPRTEAPVASGDAFFVALKACLGRETEQPMQEYMEIEIETAAVERNLQFENLHFRLRNGSERRLQIIPSEGDIATVQSGGHLQIKVFGVDSEDLPVPESIPASILSLPLARQMHALSEGREPHYSQRRELVKLSENQVLDVEWINGKIQEFQWTDPGFVLSCHQETCVCQRGQLSN